MKAKEFNQIVNSRLKRIKETLINKAKEYATDEVRLHNFKKSARRRNTTPEHILLDFMEKHSVSLDDMVENAGKVDYHYSLWSEKIGDAINYLILLEALVLDRKNGIRALRPKAVNYSKGMEVENEKGNS